MRFVTSVAAAFVCASLALHAQDTTVKTQTKTEGAMKTVSYTGCLGAGTEAKTFTLNKVVPVTTTKTTGVAGTAGSVTTTSTEYVLVPEERVMLQQHVGHKVEVTGMMIPEGEWKTKSKTGDTKVTEKGESDHPHFRVTSVKELAEPCM